MIVSDLQFHSRFCVTSPSLEEASESWVCVREKIYNQLVNSTLDWYLIIRISKIREICEIRVRLK